MRIPHLGHPLDGHALRITVLIPHAIPLSQNGHALRNTAAMPHATSAVLQGCRGKALLQSCRWEG